MQHLGGFQWQWGGPGNGSVAPVFVLEVLRFSQQCCRFAYLGLWWCVTGYVVPAVLRGYTAFIFSFGHCDALKCYPTYSLGSSHVACLEPLSYSLLFVLISAVSRTRWGLLMRQQCVTFFSKQQYPCVQFLPVTELHCFPKLHYTASSLLSGSGLYFQNSVPNLDQSKVKALYLFYSSYFCNHMKHNHAIPECWRYGLHTLEASVHSQSHWRIFMVDKVPMGQVPPPVL